MKIWKEFKTFAFKGNVVDMAVGVMIGGAFNKIVTSLVNNIFTPLISLITGGVDFSSKSIALGEENSLNYGLFIQNVIDFLIMAFCIFLFVKFINKLRKSKEEAPKPEPRKCPYCKSVIDNDATRCPHCTSEL